MKYFFNTVERILRLNVAARRWLGTPFVKDAMICGAGVDCVHLNAGVYLELGVLREFAPPRYSLDEGRHANGSKVLDWFAAQPQFLRVDPARLLPGDSLYFQMPIMDHHVGLLLSDQEFVHPLPGRLVRASTLRESLYGRRLRAAFRPLEL